VAKDTPEQAKPSSPSHSLRHKQALNLPGTVSNDEERASTISKERKDLSQWSVLTARYSSIEDMWEITVDALFEFYLI